MALMKKFKKIVTALTLTALLGSTYIFADSKLESTQDIGIIPCTMEPGTIVEYDSQCNMKITKMHEEDLKQEVVKSSKSNDSNKDISEGEKRALAENRVVKLEDEDEDMELPKAEPGMTVFYDGEGKPAIIRSRDDNNSNRRVKRRVKPNLARQVVYGQVSYYYGVGKTGADGKKLEDHDCATKMGFDEPPAGTSIDVRNLDTNKVTTVYKYDLGKLNSKRIVDVQPAAFKELGVSTSQGVIKNARYYHK